MTRSLIVGVAGHVDHGKTSLVKALTGVDLDREPEEKRRGLTINVGHTTLDLDSGTIFFVDVPGHQAYLHNTVRGLWGIEAAILVIAADEGVMPQTLEHLSVIEAIGVSKGIVVITKVDLVDEEILPLAEEEARRLVKDTFLNDAPIIHFSSSTGTGRLELTRALESILSGNSPSHEDRPFMMPVDGVFPVAGYGTVVTGSIASGRICTDSEIEIYPCHVLDKVRCIQTGRRWTDSVKAGMRAGINLRRISHTQIKKGMVLGQPGRLAQGRFFNAEIRLRDYVKQPLKNYSTIRVFCGSSHKLARLVLMDREVLMPGDRGFCQLRFKDEVAALSFFPLVIASLSPVRILGGGLILEVSRRKWRTRDQERVDYLRLLSQGEAPDIVLTILEESYTTPIELEKIAITSGRSLQETKDLMMQLVKKHKVLCIGERFYLRRHFEALIQTAIDMVSDFHQSHPDHLGISLEEIRNRFSTLDGQLKDVLLETLRQDKKLEPVGSDRLRLAGFRPHLPKNLLEISHYIVSLLEKMEPKPVTLSNILERLGSPNEADVRRVLSFLIRTDKVVRIFHAKKGNREEFITTEYLERIKRDVEKHICSNGRLTFDDTAKVIPIGRVRFNILDYLDSIGFTRRLNDMSRVMNEPKSLSGRGPHRFSGEKKGHSLQ
ncbi:Selenocysteine-specific translation elongation factor [Dissulfuribacter thermophilus]|uniref:Selenocysteine-specific translation elongation factor n=1 Tax=Dissulfuribacter thermophilus TaxID=1156395 RepID=A0A1B9F3Q4_9BACT|nr:selenocysteine-specific translation elongation factor [Dissulfuribacter thermophilus]OCC14493.1 Selenocysteine-specific translation elongation factor [Dissulfuribacter thermophilus]